jgi:hypothetical protein
MGLLWSRSFEAVTFPASWEQMGVFVELETE